jgi:hypothetical protein
VLWTWEVGWDQAIGRTGSGVILICYHSLKSHTWSHCRPRFSHLDSIPSTDRQGTKATEGPRPTIPHTISRCTHTSHKDHRGQIAPCTKCPHGDMCTENWHTSAYQLHFLPRLQLSNYPILLSFPDISSSGHLLLGMTWERHAPTIGLMLQHLLVPMASGHFALCPMSFTFCHYTWPPPTCP